MWSLRAFLGLLDCTSCCGMARQRLLVGPANGTLCSVWTVIRALRAMCSYSQMVTMSTSSKLRF